MPDKKILIAAGGTGGHIYPGIALAKEFRARGFDPVFFVRRNDMGISILDKEGFEYFEIPAMGFRRSLSPGLLKFPFVTLGGLAAAFILMRKIKPAFVAGMGGYVSFPAIICAKLLGIPSLIHEQNVLPGLTNRILSHFSSIVAVSFEGSRACFPDEKVVLTGNPVRPDLFMAPKDETYNRLGLSEGKFTVLVFGGSQGAAKINRTVLDSFQYLGDVKDRIQFLHIAGAKDYELVRKAYQEKSIPGTVSEYAHAIGDAYAVADMIICRSGATTVAELRILNKYSLLIPFPFATENHQESNARELEKEGLAKVIIERDLTPGLLAAEIIKALHSVGKNHSFKIPGVFPQELIAASAVKLIN